MTSNVVPASVFAERRMLKNGTTGLTHVHTAHLGSDVPQNRSYFEMLEAEANLVDFDNLIASPEETHRDPAS
jgi:hypothetical protein